MKSSDLNLFLCTSDIYLVDAMKMIDENAKGILFVKNDDEELVGSISDGDIRRWLINTGKIEVSISLLINKKPKFLFSNERKDACVYMKANKIKALPILDRNNHIKDIVFCDDLILEDSDNDISTPLRNTNIVIMAGGKGTRLHPYTKILPKPLIPIGEIPIIERIINSFLKFGVSCFYLTVNYKKEMIKSYFNEIAPNYQLNYIEENKPLGTAGSIKLINKVFDSPTIIVNCDILINADYSKMLDYHNESGNCLTIISALKNIVVPYGVLHTKQGGEITSIEEKPKLSYFINTGMYIINPEYINEIPSDTFFHMTDLAEKLMKKGEKIGMYPVSEDAFLDMGEIGELKRMEEKLDI